MSPNPKTNDASDGFFFDEINLHLLAKVALGEFLVRIDQTKRHYKPKTRNSYGCLYCSDSFKTKREASSHERACKKRRRKQYEEMAKKFLCEK